MARIPWCLLALLVALAVLVVPAGAAPGGDPQAWALAEVDVVVDALTYDHVQEHLLVAVDSSVPRLGNSLVEMDPRTAAIGRTLPLGSGTAVLAVADDGSRVYAALTDSPVVVEIDLATFTERRRIPLGSSPYYGPFFADALAVQPGSPGVIAVTRRSCCSSGRGPTSVFEDGVERPVTIPWPTFVSRLSWSDDPGVLYGYDSKTSLRTLFRLAVDGDGVTIDDETSPFSGAQLDITYAGGAIQATNGQVADAATLTLQGSYGRAGLVVADAAAGATYLLTDEGTLHRHDARTLLTEWTRAVPAGDYAHFVDAGSVLAAASTEELVLVGPAVTGAGYVPPAPTPSVLDPANGGHLAFAPSGLAASPDGRRVYVSVANGAAVYPGQVLEIDVASRSVLRHVFVGGDPAPLAVTSDGSRLVVGHANANRVTEVGLDDFTVARTVLLEAEQLAEHIAPVPGDGDAYVLQLDNDCCLATRDGLVLVDGGVMQPVGTSGLTGPTSVVFLDDPTRVYGHNGGSTGWEFFTVGVAADGVTVLRKDPMVMKGSNIELVAAGGLVYASSGQAADPVEPLPLGRFAASGWPVPLAEVGRMLLVDEDGYHEFDLEGRWAVADTALGAGSGDVVGAVAALGHVVVARADRLLFVPVVEAEAASLPPGAVASLGAVAEDGSVALSWVPPAGDASGPAAAYAVSWTPDDGSSVVSGPSATVVGLRNGTAYTFTVRGLNAAGAGPARSVSTTPRGAPEPPAKLRVTTEHGVVQVRWAVPTGDGGLPILDYQVMARGPGGAIVHRTGARHDSFDSLAPGVWEITVRARNQLDLGPAATAQATVLDSVRALGYWMLELAGAVHGFGAAGDHPGDNYPAIAIATTPDGAGVWVLRADGRVRALGGVAHHGDLDPAVLEHDEAPSALSVLADGSGYWIFTDRGRAFAFGAARHHGDMAGVALNGPVMASVATPTGEGYYMIGSDGGVFAFGDAAFAGSMGGAPLNGPIVGIAPDPDGHGYWLVADDGGIFAFDAAFRGSMGGIPLNRPVRGAVAYADGYLMVGADGGIFNFSSVPFLGSLGSDPPYSSIVGVAAFAG